MLIKNLHWTEYIVENDLQTYNALTGSHYPFFKSAKHFSQKVKLKMADGSTRLALSADIQMDNGMKFHTACSLEK